MGHKIMGVHADAAVFDELKAGFQEVKIPVMMPDDFGRRQIGTAQLNADGTARITIEDGEAVDRIYDGEIHSYSLSTNKKENN